MGWPGFSDTVELAMREFDKQDRASLKLDGSERIGIFGSKHGSPFAMRLPSGLPYDVLCAWIDYGQCDLIGIVSVAERLNLCTHKPQPEFFRPEHREAAMSFLTGKEWSGDGE